MAGQRKGGGEQASPAAARAQSTACQRLLAAAAGTTAARAAAVLTLACGADGRTLVDAALAQARCTLAGARLAAPAAVTDGAAELLAAIDRGYEGHEAQRRPEKETVHGKTLFA